MPGSAQVVLDLPGSGRALQRGPRLGPSPALPHSGSTKRGKRARHGRQKADSCVVRAVVAPPEKETAYEVPPFEAWSTGAPIKKRTDIKTILLLGAGPIVIGQVLLRSAVSARQVADEPGLLSAAVPQACEFDYSGTQACKALR